MRKTGYLLAFAILLVDQLSKAAVRAIMYVGESIHLIEGIFHITYVQNRGAAFGMLLGQKLFLIIIPIVAVLVALWYLKEHSDEHWTLHISLSLIISGGVGNLIDRIALGYVTDMFDFRIWPVFNVADIAVCIGAGLLILYTIFYYDKKKA